MTNHPNPKISFTGKNLNLLADVVFDAIANVNTEIGMAQNDEDRDGFEAVKQTYFALQQRIKQKLSE